MLESADMPQVSDRFPPYRRDNHQPAARPSIWFPDNASVWINQRPAFEVTVLQTTPKMGGVGEIGAPAVALAQANASSR